MTKIGLMGGSFNPVHRQHLAIARRVREALALDEVRLVPVFQPVHKSGDTMLPFARRVELLRAAIGRERGLVVDDVEQRLAGLSYTIRTVRYLKEQLPYARFWLIIGSDSLHDLPNWYESETLIREIPLCVCARPGFSVSASLPGSESVRVDIEEDPLSSSELRRQLSQGTFDRRGLVPEVVSCLVEHDLFDCLGNSHRAWIERLRAELSEIDTGLREHIESVARGAAGYAFEQGADPRDAYVAGLAHDLRRLADPAENVRLAQKAGWVLSALECELPMLAHGAAAAAHLAEFQPPPPPSLLEAIRRHTTLDEQSDPLARALVLGDYLDPSRRNAKRDELRRLELAPEERYARVMQAKRRKVERDAAGKRNRMPEDSVPAVEPS